MELKTDPGRKARGTIIESKLDKGRGPVATVIVQSGTLRVGDAFIAGFHAGKVRALIDDSGKRINEAGPSMPVEVIGLSDVPTSGDIFSVVEDEKRSRQIALIRQQKQKLAEIAKARKLTLDEPYAKIREGEIRELNIIIKGDAQGSVEAVKDALENITHPQVKVKAIHSSVGGINESDVMLAAASSAIGQSCPLRSTATARDSTGRAEVDFESGGWVVLRAYNERPNPWVLDLYPYATTSPVWFDSPAPPPAPADAAYFVIWMDRVVEAALARGGWNSEQEKTDTLAYLEAARAKFRALAAH